ncbi:MAG: hypothetical protein P8Y67_13480 [Alphaproteobacteria bacterium]
MKEQRNIDPHHRAPLIWSSGRGPNTHIHEGTLASAGVVIRERSPASLIIPALRRFLGISAQAG